MAKKHSGKMVEMLSPENYIRKKARTLPLYECMVNDDWDLTRIVNLTIARQHTNGNITACLYLIDLMLLGVKDSTYIFNIPIAEYRARMDEIVAKMPMNKVSYELAHNIVYAGLEYAEEYGFSPDKTFTSITRYMIEEDTEEIELMEIECGLEGKPAFLPGPDDDEVKVNRIVAQLEKTAGKGNYILLDEEAEFDEDDADEFEEMEFTEKKELFLDLCNRPLNEDDESLRSFASLANSIIDDLIDVEKFIHFKEEYFKELSIEVDENEIPDELLGISPGGEMDSEELKSKFVEIYNLIEEDIKLARKEFKAFEKEAKGLPATYFLNLRMLNLGGSEKYIKRLEEYALNFPNYPLIQLLWTNHQIITLENVHEIQKNSLSLKNFFPDRERLHPIELHYILVLYAFMLKIDPDINKMEAFSSVLEHLDLPDDEIERLDLIVFIIKINHLKNLLQQ